MKAVVFTLGCKVNEAESSAIEAPENAQDTGESEEILTVSKLIGETPDDKKE